METTRLTPAVVLAFVALAACRGPAVHTNTFATFQEARDSGAVDRGWVPALLPPGAYELRAAYEPNGSRRWGILNVQGSDVDALRRALEPEEVSLSGVRMNIPARIEWWPVALRGDLDPEQLANTGLRAYRAKTGDLIFAVNWAQGRAYYWVVSP